VQVRHFGQPCSGVAEQADDRRVAQRQEVLVPAGIQDFGGVVVGDDRDQGGGGARLP
jgi:hypothetical protein